MIARGTVMCECGQLVDVRVVELAGGATRFEVVPTEHLNILGQEKN